MADGFHLGLQHHEKSDRCVVGVKEKVVGFWGFGEVNFQIEPASSILDEVAAKDPVKMVRDCNILI